MMKLDEQSIWDYFLKPDKRGYIKALIKILKKDQTQAEQIRISLKNISE